MQFLRACDPARFERGREAMIALLADSLPAWHRIAELAGAPEIVIPHGHVTAWMTTRGAEDGLAAFAKAKWGSTTSYREMTSAELARYGAVLNRVPQAAVVFTGTGQVSEPQAAREVILASFGERGGEIVIGSATRVEASGRATLSDGGTRAVSYTHLTLPTNREV